MVLFFWADLVSKSVGKKRQPNCPYKVMVIILYCLLFYASFSALLVIFTCVLLLCLTFFYLPFLLGTLIFKGYHFFHSLLSMFI